MLKSVKFFSLASAFALLASLVFPTVTWATARADTPVVGVKAHSTSHATRTLPAALRPAVYRALAKDAGAADRIHANGCALLPKQELKACFDSAGAHFTGASWLSLRLTACGRGGKLAPVGAVHPIIHGNEVRYEHGNLTAWWRMLPLGFEQGFTLRKRPSGHGELTLALTTSKPGTDSIEDAALAWGKLRYGKLVVTDAYGKLVPATLRSAGGRILIAVNDIHAAYPLTVDPLLWIAQQVAASDGVAGDSFGYAVALNGTTALIGAPFASTNGNQAQGVVYVFGQSNGRWTQRQELTASNGAASNGAADDRFGAAVALESRRVCQVIACAGLANDHFGAAVALDGTTALIGAPSASTNGNQAQGVVYVFTQSNGVWSQKQELTASDAAEFDFFGKALAVSGSTAVIGAPIAGTAAGAAYVFAEANGTWVQQQKLTASDAAEPAFFGAAVALDGTTAVIGAPFARIKGNPVQGTAYVFGESRGAWAQKQELVASNGAAGDRFGASVALDGTTALIGAPSVSTNGNRFQGAVYVFGDSSGTWTQTAILTPSDATAVNAFGWSVALSGPTAVVAGFAPPPGSHPIPLLVGAGYVFGESNGRWTQKQKLEAGLVLPVLGQVLTALDGSTVLLGATKDAFDAPLPGPGTAYFFGASDLGLTVSAPAAVNPGQSYLSQTIATNSSSTASPVINAAIAVPAAASFVSATATQGHCSSAAFGVVTCDFGAISGNAGTARANVVFKAHDKVGATIHNVASIALATPSLTASAPTQIKLLPVDLDVLGSVSPTGVVNAGAALAYTISVQNLPDAQGAATETELSYEIPEGVNYIAAIGANCAPLPSSSGHAAGVTGGPIAASVIGPATVVCDLGTIAANAGKAVTITVRATAAASTVSATFVAKAREPDSDSGNNTLTLTTNPNAGPPGPAGPTGPQGSKGSGGLTIGGIALLAFIALAVAAVENRRRRKQHRHD